MSRVCLSANLNVFVNSSTGNDTTGDGTANAPWASLQHARDTIQETIDMCSHGVIYNCTGVFAGLTAHGPLVGQRNPNHELFNFTSGSLVDAPNGTAFGASYGAKYAVQCSGGGLSIRANGATGICACASDGSTINLLNGFAYYGDGGDILQTSWGGTIYANGGYVSGDLRSFAYASGGVIQLNPGNTWYIMGNPAYSKAFMWAYDGTIGCDGQTWTIMGVVTGRKWIAELTGKIATGEAESWLPGSLDGYRLSGGQYV